VPTASIIDRESIGELAARFSGRLLLPGGVGYDEARRIHNALINKRPALIARCLGTADVVDAVNFARIRGIEVAIRGGGHNVAGKAVCDGGLMIDLSRMKGIHVDPEHRTVCAQGGVTWREFNRATQLHGLATTGGVISTTGIAGLTLGGGLGWLMGKHGLALDNLLSVELVTASGEVLRASERDNPDLFWAVRGAGPNFGVACWLEYRLHPVGPVTSGLVAHPIAKARRVCRYFREMTRSLPDETTLFAALLHAPDGSGSRIIAIIGCHSGTPPEGEAALRPIKEFGSPLLDLIGPATYESTNMMLDACFPAGALNYWKSSFLSELSEPAIERMIAQFAMSPSTMSGLVIEHVHGATTRVAPTETAFPHRREGYNLLIVAEWLDPRETARNIAWARETYDAMAPFCSQDRYVNYLAEDDVGDPIRAAYGPNYERLQALKAKYDPKNFFHLNQNIPPAS
jgi:FAD/FMN-containing dehydrogenase